MATPMDSSRTYQASISMTLNAVLLLLSPQAAKCSTQRVGAELTANVLVPGLCGLWRFSARQILILLFCGRALSRESPLRHLLAICL